MKFRDEYYFLSNMYPAPVTVVIGARSFTFSCAEAAFQAQKCPERAGEFLNIDGFAAKRLGYRVSLCDNWDNMKLGWMCKVLEAKFTQNKELAKKLIATGDTELVEDNTWKDTYWGRYNGYGENHLGKLLMEIREELQARS